MFSKPQIRIGICFAVFLGLLSMACSDDHSATAPTIQEQTFNNAHESHLDSLENARFDCSDANEFTFPVVENPNRRKVAEPLVPKDVEIRVGGKLVAKIELPIPDSEAKNFSLVSTTKSKEGFEMIVEWGGGRFHYEIQFSFTCKEKKLYLYKVVKSSFSTTDPNSGNFWDKKETKEIKVEPNLSIEKFVMLDYLK